MVALAPPAAPAPPDVAASRIGLPLAAEPSPPGELLPARMLNEFAYCPRLGYLEWVQGEWADNLDTVDGEFVHRRVDQPDRREVASPSADGKEPEADAQLHTRSLRLESAELGLVAVVDVVELEGSVATPVDYKKSKAPDLPEGAWEPERVQLCAQGLLLRSAGFACTEGVLWFAGSRRRVVIPFTEELIARTRSLIAEFRQVAAAGQLPPPLVDSPKCPRCSLVGICLPDETNLLRHAAAERSGSPRLLLAPHTHARPLHVLEQGARVGKSGERLVVERKDEMLAKVPLAEVAQLCLFGNVQVSTQALAELLDRDIPVCWFSMGGWFRGVAGGLAHKNIELRIKQFAAAASPNQSLALAAGFVAGKIQNCRTLLRRNLPDDPEGVLEDLAESVKQAERAASLATLLGIEGMAAKRYFGAFSKLLKADFDFAGRNRRPPTDPVNGVLSYLYSLLTKELHVAAQAAGLDPMLGFLHQPRYGRPALALDLAEEFRPLVADSVCLSLFNTGEVKEEHFIRRAGACTLTPAGKRAVLSGWERRLNSEVTHPHFGYSLSYRRVLAVQTRLLGRVLLGEIPIYPAFRTR